MATKKKKTGPRLAKYEGYRGVALECLKYFGAGVGDTVVVETRRERLEGQLMARARDDDEHHILLRLADGYNVGVAVSSVTRITTAPSPPAPAPAPDRPRQDKKKNAQRDRPKIKILIAGEGPITIVDPTSDGVVGAKNAEAVYDAVPTLAELCHLETVAITPSRAEDVGVKEYLALAEATAKAIAEGAPGVVISHGAATLAHTAATLSFMVQKPPVPVVFVSAAPAGDAGAAAAVNLVRAVRFALHAEVAEVVVCAPGLSSDRYALIHRATRVKRLHPTARAAFRTVGDTPLAMVTDDKIIPLRDDYNRRRETPNYTANAAFESRVAMIYYYPTMDRDLIDAVIDRGFRGLILAGPGPGLIGRTCYPALKRASENRVVVVMALQTPWGYASLEGDEAGRELRDLGVIAAANMLAEVAYLKLCWVLGQTSDVEEVRRLMLTPIAGEITPREAADAYLVLQSGVPETAAFLENNWL